MEELLLKIGKRKRNIKMDLLWEIKIPVTNGYTLILFQDEIQRYSEHLIGVVVPEDSAAYSEHYSPIPVDLDQKELYGFHECSSFFVLVDSDSSACIGFDNPPTFYNSVILVWENLEGFILQIYRHKRSKDVVFVFKRHALCRES